MQGLDREARLQLGAAQQGYTALEASWDAARGIAERMFISRHTVQFHVSNSMAKLGLSSRVELAALVVRRAGSQNLAT